MKEFIILLEYNGVDLIEDSFFYTRYNDKRRKGAKNMESGNC